jgi:low affinity Fe/Cu permease
LTHLSEGEYFIVRRATNSASNSIPKPTDKDLGAFGDMSRFQEPSLSEGLLGTTKTTINMISETTDCATVIVSGPDRFTKFSVGTSHYFGSRWAFLAAIAVVVTWALTGPLFHYSDTWQLVINTGTTIVTFLMVFLIQNTQNRDAKAIHLKLNELIHAIDKAKNRMIDVEKLSDGELEELAKTYEKIRISAQDRQKRGSVVTDQGITD